MNLNNQNNQPTVEVIKEPVEPVVSKTIEDQSFINEDLRSSFVVRDDMLIKNGRKVTSFESPHKNATRNICDFVIIHYTGSHGTYKSSTDWAADPKSKVSWHLTVGRKGEINQHIDGFRTVLWHAGQSEWNATNVGKLYKSLNRYSIGIEIANAGKLTQNEKGKWVSTYGKVFTDDNVFIADDGTGWEKFTNEQIETVCAVALVLAEEYNCVDILGHNEISPGRKIDPGPAFPLLKLREELHKRDFYKFN